MPEFGPGSSPGNLLAGPLEFQPPHQPIRRLLAATGFFRLRTWLGAHGVRVPDIGLYQPLFSPWEGLPEFEQVHHPLRHHTLVTRDRSGMRTTLESADPCAAMAHAHEGWALTDPRLIAVPPAGVGVHGTSDRRGGRVVTDRRKTGGSGWWPAEASPFRTEVLGGDRYAG